MIIDIALNYHIYYIFSPNYMLSRSLSNAHFTCLSYTELMDLNGIEHYLSSDFVIGPAQLLRSDQPYMGLTTPSN